MTETMDGKREAYMDWLRGEVERWCDESGFFQMEWDNDDSITPDQIIDAWEHFEGEGYASPLAYLESELLNSLYVDAESNFYENCLLRDLDSAPGAVQDGWDEAQSVYDDLAEAGYQGIDMNLDALLRQSSFAVNLFFATEAEADLDMGGIVSAFGSACWEPDLSDVTPEEMDNALSYLIDQQGHSVTELYSAIADGKADSALIESVREEIGSNSSEAMSELCALVRMDGNQMLGFLDALEKSNDSLVLPKDYAIMGIFNQLAGCGGLLDIRLEKDAVLPLSMVREFNIEGQSNTPDSYTVDEVYGLVNSAWCRNFTYRDGTEPHVKEDYAAALSQAREAAKQREDTEKHTEEPRPSLKNAAEESRESSQALGGHAAPNSYTRDEH